MKFILVCIGSYGDIYPLLGIGVTLKKRGWDVMVLGNGYFKQNVLNMGLAFHPIGTLDDYYDMLANPDSIKALCDVSVRPIRPVLDYIAENYIPGETVMVTNGSLGVRLAHEKYGIPMISINLMPLLFYSSHEPPLFSFKPYPSWWPRWVFKGLWTIVGCVYDHYWRPSLNTVRAELGLPPQPRMVARWAHSPQKIIGLFPQWFAKPQPDWPAHARQTNFPLFDEGAKAHTALPEELESFLSSGAPPIIITPGTPNKNFTEFFEKALHAVNAIGARAIFVTTHEEQIPRNLPPHIRFYKYLPFSQVFPRAGLLVHHGGIGTMAQAMRAGIPHLVTPWGFDQYDNGAKIKALGLGDIINTRSCTVEELAATMQHLLHASEVRAHCQSIAQRLRNITPLEDTCRIIEEAALRHLSETMVAKWRSATGETAYPVHQTWRDQAEDHV